MRLVRQTAEGVHEDDAEAQSIAPSAVASKAGSQGFVAIKIEVIELKISDVNDLELHILCAAFFMPDAVTRPASLSTLDFAVVVVCCLAA